MRILIAWELGANYGHATTLLPLAQQLRQRGHDVLLAVKDLRTADAVCAPHGIRFVQAPASTIQSDLGREVSSYADILAAHGWRDPATLAALAHGWQHLLTLFQPDLLISAYAPTASFAGYLAGVRRVELGTGFELAPLTSPFPDFRSWLNTPRDTFITLEAQLLTHLNSHCNAHGAAPLQRLCDLFDVPRFLSTFAEIDHYPTRTQFEPHSTYVGPLIAPASAATLNWAQAYARNIFVYLQSGDHLEAVLARLAAIEANIICVVPGASDALIATYAAPHLQITRAPLALKTLLAHCDLVISHASHGIVSACLHSGVPMLLLPQHIEQMLVSKQVMRLGAGLGVLPADLATHFAPQLVRLLTDTRFKENAQALQRRVASHDPAEQLRTLCERIVEVGRFVK